MGLKDRIFPKESNFYKMLSDQASKTLEGIEALEAFVGNQNQENANRVKEIEREADELRRILVEELHQTFITPMDREDIHKLRQIAFRQFYLSQSLLYSEETTGSAYDQ